MGRFEGKPVIVTGAASGFGAAIAVKFGLEGASVLCADLNLAGAQEVAAGLPYAQASEEAGFLTGVALDIDGGRSIQ